MEVEKVDDMAMEEAVDQVSDDAPTEEAKGDLYQAYAQSEVTAKEEDG